MIPLQKHSSIIHAFIMKFSSLAWIVAAIHITTAAAAVRDVHCFKSHPAEVRIRVKLPEVKSLTCDQWESNCGEADRAACSSRCEGTVSDQDSFLFPSLTKYSVKQRIPFPWRLPRVVATAGATANMENVTLNIRYSFSIQNYDGLSLTIRCMEDGFS